jgi:hypothetical protein
MNNLLHTKPTYAETHATNKGWVQTSNGELLVAVKGLLTESNGILPGVIVKRKPGRPRKIV